jgi:hypothetical protein
VGVVRGEESVSEASHGRGEAIDSMRKRGRGMVQH